MTTRWIVFQALSPRRLAVRSWQPDAQKCAPIAIQDLPIALDNYIKPEKLVEARGLLTQPVREECSMGVRR